MSIRAVHPRVRGEHTLDSYSFAPAHIIVQSGKPVEFTLQNVSSLASHSV